MKTKSSKKLNSKLQRFLKRPLYLPFNKPKNWRVKNYLVKITPKNHYLITLRTFKTNPNNRSKLKVQRVFKFGLFGVKEVAIWHKTAKKRKPKSVNPALHVKKGYSYAVMALGLFGFTFFGWQIFTDVTRKPPAVVVQAEAIQLPDPEPIEKVGIGKSNPTQITIENLQIDYPVNPVGQLEDGSIETPDIFDKWVGWYKYSPTPGDVGPAVLVGHVDTYKGPSVFWRLSEATPGQIVQIKREDGQIAKYKIYEVNQYSQDEFPTEKVYGNTETPELRLITCGGNFNYFTLKYNKNTVVYARLIS